MRQRLGTLGCEHDPRAGEKQPPARALLRTAGLWLSLASLALSRSWREAWCNRWAASLELGNAAPRRYASAPLEAGCMVVAAMRLCCKGRPRVQSDAQGVVGAGRGLQRHTVVVRCAALLDVNTSYCWH